MMRIVARTLPLLILIVVSGNLLAAGAQGAGKISLVGGQVSGQPSVYFGISPEPVDRAGCNNNGSYQFVLDPATEGGKALYSAILAAKSTEKRIRVKGSGVCGLGQAMETVSYWIIID